MNRIKSTQYINGRVKSQQISNIREKSLILVTTRIFSYQLVPARASFVTGIKQRVPKERNSS